MQCPASLKKLLRQDVQVVRDEHEEHPAEHSAGVPSRENIPGSVESEGCCGGRKQYPEEVSTISPSHSHFVLSFTREA